MADPPTGTVTFLFTDIEGSSRLWDEHPGEMSGLLARHDEIIRSTVAEHDGEVFATAGDSFAAAFSTPEEAVSAAVTAQTSLAKELRGDLRVRMGMHAGPAERRGGDYFGPVLNRGARLRDAAHGGQVLLTEATYDLVVGKAPEVQFADLGEHRLRDLTAPEHVYQVYTPGLAAEVPPIRSLGAFVHNLPTQLTPFVGRSEEIETIETLLDETRHATLLGPGGSGKTRLALQVAAESMDRYPNGAWWVDLRDLADHAEVAPHIAATLRVMTAGERAVADQLVEALWSRPLLLILDNCEHVLAAVAPFVERLLSRDGEIRILVTSREPLSMPGESTMPLRPLPLPESAELDQLLDCEAAQLFTERAHSARADFAVEQHADSVFQICQSCEGSPLALELAAARLRAVSPEEVASRLDDQLGMLRTTLKAGDLRHATMEATIRWSWGLLEDAEQTLFSRLSVFRGTWSLEAAEAICGFEPIDRGRVLDLLGSLVDKSLVVAQHESGGSTRYRFLEPIRQFAARELDEPDTKQLRGRLIDYWRTSLDATATLRLELAYEARALEPDQTNMTAAVEWALEAGRYEDAMAIFASTFGDLLYLQGSSFELASGWMDTAVGHREQISPDVLLAALEKAGGIAAETGRHEAWVQYAELGIELSRTPEERHGFELGVAVATGRMGRYAEADAIFERVVAATDDPGFQASALIGKIQFETPKRTWTLAQQAMELSSLDSLRFWDEDYAVFAIGGAARNVGRYDVAAQMRERSVELSRQHEYLVMEAYSASGLAQVYAAVGRLDESATLVEEMVQATRRLIGHDSTVAELLGGTAADFARLQGDLDKARQYLNDARQASERYYDLWSEVLVIHQTALVARDDHDLDQARMLLESAARRLEGTDEGRLLTWILAAQASVELRAGVPERARVYLRDVMANPDRLHQVIVAAVEMVAVALAQQGKPQPAARLIGAVDQERQRTGLVIQPPDASIRETAIHQAQSSLGEDWDAEVSEGRTMTLEQAVEYAFEYLAG